MIFLKNSLNPSGLPCAPSRFSPLRFTPLVGVLLVVKALAKRIAQRIKPMFLTVNISCCIDILKCYTSHLLNSGVSANCSLSADMILAFAFDNYTAPRVRSGVIISDQIIWG